METTKDRLIEFLAYKGISQRIFEQSVGLSNGFVNNIGDTIRQKSQEKIKEIYPEINLSWLITGEGSMFKDGAEPMAKNILPATAINYEKGVPYYDIDFLGGFDLIINEKTSTPSYMIDYQPYNKADAWCNITGHSMEPLISSGDVIAIKELKDWMDFIPYGEIYAIITEEHRTIKRVTKSERGNDFLQLIPENKSIEYQPQDLPKKLILKIFKVLGAMKRF